MRIPLFKERDDFGAKPLVWYWAVKEVGTNCEKEVFDVRWGDVEEEKFGFVQAWCCGGVGRGKDVVKEILSKGRALVV